MFLEAIITSNCAPLLSVFDLPSIPALSRLSTRRLKKKQVYISDIFRQDRSIHTIYNDENESIQRVMVTIQLDRYVAPTQAPLSQPLCVVCLIRLHDKLVLLDVRQKVMIATNINPKLFVCRLVLNVTLGTQFYFYHESQATQFPTLNIPDAGSAEQRVVPLVYLPKYGGVKKLEYVRLSKLNIYVLNSPLQHHTSDDMSVAVKLSMVPNPLVKSSCSYHTNGPDDVPIIEGCPASTDPEPAHTDSVLTSTETPIDDEKAPVQSKLEILITPTMETWNLQNSIQLFVSKFYVFFNNVVIHILLLSTKVFLSTYLWYSAI
ncbi:hypothetical protein HID58_028891 [Brassica napus]|uniref:Uncharacterized protein n=1 Tax=Brassica napus TaxID=3708 RepID=A0ABQ8CBM1_BRANA|nr:hypothetical protein HID58_028891 [Brassica napus]